MAQQEIIHAYRHLYRHSLRAILYSKPARYTLRSRIRLAFRKSPPEAYDPQRVANTIEFLQYAARENGLEHKIVKNLLLVWWNQDLGGYNRAARNTTRISNEGTEIKTTAYDTFNHSIMMLNESMGMCLPHMTTRDPI
ncbi:DUF1763-domain-containing protein [Aaosphaeria arxii CBS 175.79]|uniref:DUF1763-domain-containing protein n=1 Tax=Aaosphaeria arxii CBS 175.79 TaxID=1450172 RepID=A0A6A5Y5Y3_9PLEO|nr:DUF1763-domain-containing protein [Aaosphaeria arxii CBS 175.79]KAF2019964.1 DUF1763-domain-containing protein [Aaosphaeria arxii CBS 175.79]